MTSKTIKANKAGRGGIKTSKELYVIAKRNKIKLLHQRKIKDNKECAVIIKTIHARLNNVASVGRFETSYILIQEEFKNRIIDHFNALGFETSYTNPTNHLNASITIKIKNSCGKCQIEKDKENENE